MTPELDAALADLKRAVAFFDKVQASSVDERNAVGVDHYRWLESASRNVVAAYDNDKKTTT